MPIPTPPTKPTIIPIQNVAPQESIAYTTQQADLVNGNMFLNDGTSLLQVFNGCTGGRTATVTVYSVPDEAARTGTGASGIAYPNLSIGWQAVVQPSVKGTASIFGSYRQAWWNQTMANVGYVYLGVSISSVGSTGVYIGVINY